MNKQCFRVIFSKTLQRLVVVSELAKSEGKSAETSTSGTILQKICKMRPLVFSLFCALGFVAFSDNVLAETLIIQADKSAPKNQQPIILQTANGLPQVNIQTPNSKGLSHNKYSQFDVAEQGAILNNSRTDTQTQRAGMVQGNPYLARGEAKVILNEVNSNKPSVMKGYVEVAGKKAEVIIANPSGLHCEGCGIINADRATFTTGKPEIKNGQVDNFKVEAGKVKVSGQGLDNSRVDYTEIIAREAEVNAGIWSNKETKVITGKNTVKRSETDKNLQIIHTNQPLAGEAKPQVAIDVGELGGMYSGKIHLIGTENGVGVRNAGHIGASADTLQIDSKGRIVNTGTINAAKTVELTAAQGVENKGKIENKQGDIQLKSQADIQNSGSIVARSGDIQKKAATDIQQHGEAVARGNIHYTAPTIHTTTESLIASGVEVSDTEQGEVRRLETKSTQGKSIQLTSSGKTTTQGKNVASGKITVSASEIDANHSQQSANAIETIAKTGDIQANQASWSASDTLDIQTPTTFSTVGSELIADKWRVSAVRANNQAGRWFGLGGEPLRLDLPQGLNNLGGVIQNQGNIEINAHMAGIDNTQGVIKSLNGSISSQSQTQLLNQQGKFVAEKNIAINHLGLNNQQGYLLAHKGNATLNLYKHALNNQQGDILAGENLSILSSTLTNLKGTLYAGQTATINTHSGNLNNQEQGNVISGRDIVLNTQNLLNDSGVLEARNNASLTIDQQLDNQKTTDTGSLVQAGNVLSIRTQQLNNHYTKTASALPESGLVAHNLDLTTPHLNNQQGGIYALANSTLNIASKLNNQQGEIHTLGDLTIQGQTLSVENQQGEISSLKRLRLNTHKLSSFGVISGGDTEINTVQGLDSHTDILGKNSLNITTQGNLINHATLHSEGKITLNAAQIENSATGKIKGEALTTTVGQNLTNRGLINTLSETVIKVGQKLHNIGTGRIYGDHIALQADTVINEDERVNDEIKSAVIAARSRLDVGANHIVNQQNALKPAEGEKSGVTLSSDGEMVFGQTLDTQNFAVGQAKTLRNTSALIEVGKGLALNVADTLNSNKYIYNVLTEKSRTPVNESYLISGNTLGSGERINFNQLKWISFSRAGKVVFNNGTQKPEDSANLATQVLPMPNEMVCQNIAAQTGCVPAPKSLYLPDDPIWAYFDIPAPQDAPPLPDLSHLDPELDAPQAPTEPRRRRRWESEAAYQARLKEYETNQAAYQAALQAYEAEKAKYESEIQPYLDWTAKNEPSFVELETKILIHNSRLLGREFSNFWVNNVNERVIKEDVATDSVPGQILVGGDLRFNGHITNNQSTILAGGTIANDTNPNTKVENNDQWGEHIIEDHGTEQWTHSRWRGGFRRYHQRDWGGIHTYMHETRTDIPLNIVNTEASSSYQKITQNNPLVNGDVVLNDNAIQTTPIITPDFTHTAEIRTVGVDSRLPSSSLYKIQPAPNSHVLIETDPEFTNKKHWLSSDYMFDALRHEHENVHKRLGDGYYELRLVQAQINQLTGRMFSDNYTTFETQYKALMDAGISFAQKFNLRPGIALTPEQVAQLTSDIVWFEPTVVRLADGSTQIVLAPRVYVVAKKGDIDGTGTLIGGRNLDLHNITELKNSGTLYGRDVTNLNAVHIENLGKISGNITALSADKILNLGGVIEAEQATLLNAKEMDLRSTTASSSVNLEGFSRIQTNLSRQALVHTKNADGVLTLRGENLTMTGAKVQNDGSGLTDIHFTGDINLNGLQVGFEEKVGGGDHYRNQREETMLVSHISGNGQVQIQGDNIYSEGANLAAKGKLVALAENNLVLGSATRSTDYAEYHHTKSGGALGRSTKTSLDTEQQLIQLGTKVSANDIVLSAKQDVKASHLQAIADNDLIIQGGNNVTISSDTNYFKTTHFKEESRKGAFLNSGGIGITFGKQSEKHEQETEGWRGSEALSTLGSLNGNITVSSGNHAQLAGVEAIASKELGKQILVEGKSTYIGVSEDTLSSKERHEQKQSGLTIAFSSAVTDGVMAAKQALDRSGQVNDERLGALLKVKSANEAYDAVQKAKKVIDALKSNGDTAEKLANSDAKISVSIGSSQSVSTSHTQQTTHKGSELDAGKVIVRATDGDNTIEGSKINATRTELEGNNVNLLGTTNSQTNRSDNKSSSWSVGAFIGKSQESSGLGVEGAMNVGKGYANSDSQVQNQTEIHSDSLNIKTKETTTLKGAVANINHLALETQNLHIESVQDTEKYDSNQSQVSGSGSLALGANGLNGGVSAQFSQNKANVDYAQVAQQSGFNIQESSKINVEENTHLIGGIINAEGDKANHQMTTGTLTTEEIENRSDIKVSSVSVGVSSDNTKMATMAVGAALSALGNMRESERSQTKAAISSNINLSITDSDKQQQLTGKTAEETLQSLNRDTANANQAVEKADLSAIQEKQETAQVIGELSQSWINRLVQPHLEEANKKRQEAEQLEKSDPLKSAQLKAEAKAIEAEYGLGSNLQMGIRAATAALQGVATGNTNQAAVGLLSPYANKLIKEQTTNADGTVNTEANLMAHAVLGAVEAHITGNNAAAGALGALTAEAAAPYLMQALYNTDKAENLTDSQKQNIANLSQIAAGLAGGVTGDSTASFISGAEIGKRAVENNYLSQFSQNRRDWLRDQLKRKDLSAKKREQYEQEYRELEQDDHTSDHLVTQALHNPEKMTKSDWALYTDYAKRYYLESIASHHRPEEVKENLNNILSNNYIRAYDYPYALAEQYRSNLPSRWSLLGINKSEDEQFYSDIAKKYENRATYENSFNGRVAKSTAEALGYAGSLVVPTSAVFSSIPKIGELAKKYPTLNEMAIIGTVNTAAQLSSKDPYLYSSLVEAELSYLLTRKDSASVAWSKNMMLGSYMEQAEKQEKEIRFGIKEDPEYFKKGLGITFGALGSKGIDIGFSQANKLYSLGNYGNNLIRPTINAAWGEWSNQKISNTFDSLNKSSEEKK